MGERAEKCGYPSKRWHGFTCSRNATVNAADGRRVCRTHRDIIDRNIASQRPTVLTMDGETSTYGLVEKSPWECWTPRPGWAVRTGIPEEETCPAPTPRAKL